MDTTTPLGIRPRRPETGEVRFRPDRYAEWFETPLGRRVWRDELRALDRLLPGLRERDVLDLGCGDGRLARLLSGRGARVVGIDLSEEMLRAARRRSRGSPSRTSLVRADAARIPLRDGSVDVVVAVTLLAFVPDPEAVVGEAARVLRADGRLVVGALGRWSAWALGRRLRGWLGNPTWRHARFWTAGDLRRLVRGAGLEVVDSIGAVRYPPLGWIARRVRPRSPRSGTLGAAFIGMAARKGSR